MLPTELAIVVVAIIGNVGIGLFTLFKNSKHATNKLLFLFIVTIVLYLVSNAFLTSQTTDAGTFFWVKMVMSIAALINIAFFLLVSTFPRQRLQTSPVVFWLTLLSPLPVFLLAQANLVFTSVTTVNSGAGIPGPGMPIFLLHTVVFLGAGFVILIRKFRRAVGLEKTQLRLFLIGTVAMFFLILVTNLLFVIFLHTAAFINLLPIYTLFFVGVISYTIIKHRFLDIRLIVARTVAYVITVAVLTFLYAGAIFWVSGLLLQEPPPTTQLIAYVLLTLFVAFTFQWLRSQLENVTDKIFFKGGYNSSELLSTLTRIMATTLHLEDIAKNTLEVLMKNMKIEHGTFVVLRDKDMYPPISKGAYAMHVKREEIDYLLSLSRLIIFDEEEDGKVKDMLRKHEIAIVLPLYAEQKVEGALLLGGKQSGDIYSSQDITLLEIFGPEVSVAIQNAKAYEEIERFNLRLKEEVERATHDLKLANDKLKELDKLKDDFVSVASHELRTPMTAIKSYLWMALAGKGGKLSEKQKYYLGRSYSSVDRLIKLVNDMLNISRIESGRLTVSFQKVDVKALVQDVVEEVQPRARELAVSVVLEAKSKLVPVVADPDKIKEVLFNLIGNSLKFTPRNGRITVAITQNSTTTTISVSDTGVGIEKDDVPKLFQKFGMIAGSYATNQPAQGTGLGLYISRSIVDIHGGTIRAESKGRNQGASFRFTLRNYTDKIFAEMSKKYNSENTKEEIGIIHTALT